ncbi:MAG: hydroxymyristoyl-ACP dehydratase [Bacteroidales bacterium]|nr:hydroxymyristoyl-ACP dehydratase [Bacteroidales bacterium]
MQKTYTIKELIPQREPMLMVDNLDHCEGPIAQSHLEIKADNIFVDNGEFRESGIMEHIAQTAAAQAGYNELIAGNPVVLGFIGSIDKMKITRLPKVGETLHTTIEIGTQIDTITMVHANTTTDNGEVAECSMKIFLKK